MDLSGVNTNDLHREFRSLIMLLTLVHTINGGQRPMFADDTHRYATALEENQPPRDRLLNAVTALLVRNHEIVATAVNRSYQVLVLQQHDISEQEAPCIVGNARDTDIYSFADHYLFAEKGTSHKHRFGDWDNLFNIEENDPLQNHAATLEDFLRSYGHLDRQARQSLSIDFNKYIIARCWEKMHRWMTHWSSHSFVHNLCRVDETDLQNKFDVCVRAKKISLSSREDSMLGGLLMGDKAKIEGLLKQLCPFPDYTPDISKLVTAFNEVKTSRGTQRIAGLGWYHKANSFEFHKLLVSALIAYANALRIFKLHKKSKSRETYAERLWETGYLLWRIGDSCILRHHLRLLNESHWLYIPKKGFLPLDPDKLFGHITSEGSVENWKSPDNRKAEEAKEVDDEEVEDDDDQSEEFLLMIDNQGYSHLDTTFLRWIQLQVAYWMAQDIVTSPKTVSMGILQSVGISIANVKYRLAPDHGMIPWKQLLQDLQLEYPSVNVEAAKATIEKAIKSRLQEPDCDRIFKSFDTPSFEPEYFSGNLHCEVVLALLTQYSQTGGGHLGDLIQDLDRTLISVSKLCCLVCWDLLGFIRTHDDKFVVRGRHAVLSPVELPSWLPSDVLKKMLHRYKELLVQEIETMMTREPRRRSNF